MKKNIAAVLMIAVGGLGFMVSQALDYPQPPYPLKHKYSNVFGEAAAKAAAKEEQTNSR